MDAILRASLDAAPAGLAEGREEVRLGRVVTLVAGMGESSYVFAFPVGPANPRTDSAGAGRSRKHPDG